MAEHNALYRKSLYYDIALSRDVRAEVDFLLALYQRFRQRAPDSLLDVACGPGYHARDFARRGGRAIGLDLRAEMIEYAREQADPAASITWIAADMRSCSLDQPVDLAFCANSGIDCLLENAEIVQHFQAVANCLAPGGLYVVELSHPRDCHPYRYGTWCYEGERDNTRVTIDWATNDPIADPVRQVSRVEVRMQVVENGTERVYTDSADERYLSAPEIAALAELSGALRVEAWFGAFDLTQPLDNSAASVVILGVMSKAETAATRGTDLVAR